MTPTEAIATGYATHGLICSQKSSEIELADVYNVIQYIILRNWRNVCLVVRKRKIKI